MIANTNKNMERSKLLAAVAVLALVVCAFAVALPAVNAAGEDDMAAYDLDSTETPVTVYASLADYNNGTNGSEKTLKAAIDELAANQVLVFSEGKYNVRDSETNQPAFVIDEDNVTVIGAGIGKTIVYTDYFSTNNESAASIIITGENSDISGMTVWDAYTLRDTGITAMLRSGCDALSVKEQARHSSLLMTDRSAKVKVTHLRQKSSSIFIKE